jgi:hypothetical protein
VLIWPVLGVILPVARVSALAWLLVAGAWLPLRRSDIRDTGRRPDRSAAVAR